MGQRCRKFGCLILVLIEIFDLITDWFFYIDVQVADKGLVFGPIDPLTVKMVLAFTIVGSIASPIEIWITVMELMYPDKVKAKVLDSLSFVIVLLEDIPQAVLLLIVSLCREEPSSVFQLTKASFIILTSIIKSVPFLWSCCKECGTLKTLALIGTSIELILGIVVFFATQVEISETGGFHFPNPTTIVEEKYNDNRYISDVSLFIHDPSIFPDTTDPRDLGWLRLESLGKIKHFECIGFRLEYQNTNTDDVKVLRVWKKESASPSKPWVQNGCYNISANGRALSLEDNQCSFSAPSLLYITFTYVSPDFFFKKRLLGDITFNAKHQKSGENTKSSLKSSDFTDSTKGTQQNQVMMHYFRHKPLDFNITDRHQLKQDNRGLRLYNVKQDDLLDVKDVWKTGWSECRTEGNLAPRFDADISVAA